MIQLDYFVNWPQARYEVLTGRSASHSLQISSE